MRKRAGILILQFVKHTYEVNFIEPTVRECWVMSCRTNLKTNKRTRDNRSQERPHLNAEQNEACMKVTNSEHNRFVD